MPPPYTLHHADALQWLPTLLAALAEGYRATGCELSAHYHKIATQRLDALADEAHATA